MKYPLLSALVFVFGSISNAQVQAIDVRGSAYMVRDGQNASILIADAAVAKILSVVSSTVTSAVQCTSSYCVIGQISRQGVIAPLTGNFVGQGYFDRLLSERRQKFAQYDAFEKHGGTADAYVSQCQDPRTRVQKSFMRVTIEGRVAERLYNFLTVRTRRAPESNTRNGASRLLTCSKRVEHDQADVPPTGAIAPGMPISHFEYACDFEITKSGGLSRIDECPIFGASSSAGGSR